MLQVHSLASLSSTPSLRDAMFSHRKRQFVDRLNWRISADDSGLEKDHYDNEYTRYLIYLSDSGNHLGSLRMSERVRNSMISDVFSEEFPKKAELNPNELEITRFCVSPSISGRVSRFVSEALIKEAYFQALALSHFDRILGVCYRPMLRIYRMAGAAPSSISYGQLDNNLILTTWKLEGSKLIDMLSDRPRHVEEKLAT